MDLLLRILILNIFRKLKILMIN